MTRILEVEIAGGRLEARGDRTLFWPAERTLFVADLHLGKGTAFRAGGYPVPAGSTAATLDNLTVAVEETQATHLVVLGDLWHARSGRTEDNLEALRGWVRARPDLRTTFVLGNHDQRSGWDADAVMPGVLLGPFALHHYPEPDPAGYVLSGHIHPSVRLSGAGRQSFRLPCFWFGASVAVLPAFGDLTGTAEIVPVEGDQVVVIADGMVTKVRSRDRSELRRR